jgi:hypothetical protein
MLLSLLLQEGPADTTSYMIAGYAVIFGVMLLYLISLLVRQRNLQKDLEVLEEIQSDQE